jgi:hypothetical protein
MEQRTLRLGDIVDDYCPRERRLTNHAIVAIVEDAIRQTRCMTCDAEHIYKGGHAPRRRLVKPAALGADGQPVPENGGVPLAARPGEASGSAGAPPSGGETANAGETNETGEGASPLEPEPADRSNDLWLANRPLIRATLPRVEGDPPPVPRPIPEFTMHQRHTRGSQAYRHGHGYGGQNPNWSGGNGHARGGPRDGRDGQGQGPGPGGGGGAQGQRPGRRGRRRGGKKNH